MFVVGNVHYAMLSDIAWAGQRSLGVASNDGFCSFLVFDKDEIGVELSDEEYEKLNLKAIIKQE